MAKPCELRDLKKAEAIVLGLVLTSEDGALADRLGPVYSAMRDTRPPEWPGCLHLRCTLRCKLGRYCARLKRKIVRKEPR